MADKDSPEKLYRDARTRLTNAHDDDTISTSEYESIIEVLDAYDERRPSTPKPRWADSHKKLRTLREYANRLRTIATRLDEDLTDATANHINRLWDDMGTGLHPDVKDDGVSTNTLNAYQSAARCYFEYHDHGPEKEDVAMVSTDKTRVDGREVFDSDDVDAMRDAIDNSRDRCIFELLIYTGQRIRALQTLRIKDVDLEDSSFYLNGDDGGLKGAEGKRPLLGAEGAVRDWLADHPNPNNPDAYLITHRPAYKKDVDGSDPLTQRSINRALKRIAENADVDKPANAHQFRHHFVTICKTKYDMDDSTIKGLIGHRADSQVMETTYAHLQDEDHKKAAEIALDLRDPDDDGNPHSPEICTNCKNPLPPNAKACSNCGSDLRPDSKSVRDEIRKRTFGDKGNIDSTKQEQIIDVFFQMMEEHPEEVMERVDLD